VETGEAFYGTAGHRQLKPMAPRINVTELARDVALGIIEGRQDDLRIRWKGHDHVTVIATKVLPETEYKATQNGRRKKLWEVLEEILEPQGWKRDKGGVFVRRSE
jgi:hypothetical protein